MAIGWFLERRIVGFDKPKRIVFGIMRFIIGFILVLALIKFTKSPLIALFGSENWAGVARYFIACFVAIFLWPLTFRAIEEHIDPASRQGKK